MKNEPEIDFIVVLAMAGHLTIELNHVIDFHNQQLRVLKDRIKHMPRLNTNQRIRLAAQFNKIEKRLRQAQETLVTPRTLMKWYQKLIKEKWDYSDKVKKKRGRPRTHKDKIEMVLKIAEENPLLGYRDIENRMINLGWDISYQTVRSILLGHGIEPSKQRAARLNWEQFQKVNMDGLFALDFTTVEVCNAGTLETYYILFIIRIKTRKVCCAGMTRNPNKRWVQQRLREHSNPFDGFLKDCTWMIMDNDGALHPNVVKPLIDLGIKIQRTPIKAPNCNTYIERFNQSFKRDALSFIIPCSEEHLKNVTNEYILFYNQERNHQGIGGRLIEPREEVGSIEGDVKVRSRNDGSLNYYYRCVA